MYQDYLVVVGSQAHNAPRAEMSRICERATDHCRLK